MFKCSRNGSSISLKSPRGKGLVLEKEQEEICHKRRLSYKGIKLPLETPGSESLPLSLV